MHKKCSRARQDDYKTAKYSAAGKSKNITKNKNSNTISQIQYVDVKYKYSQRHRQTSTLD